MHPGGCHCEAGEPEALFRLGSAKRTSGGSRHASLDSERRPPGAKSLLPADLAIRRVVMPAIHQRRKKGIIMKLENLPLKGLLAAGAMMLSLGAAVPTAAAGEPDFVLDLPIGVACPSFDLRLEGFVADSRVFRTFYDKSGNAVRMFAGGKGNVLKFINVYTNAALTLRTGGSVEKTGFNDDGSTTYTLMGHNVVICSRPIFRRVRPRSSTLAASTSTSIAAVRGQC